MNWMQGGGKDGNPWDNQDDSRASGGGKKNPESQNPWGNKENEILVDLTQIFAKRRKAGGGGGWKPNMDGFSFEGDPTKWILGGVALLVGVWLATGFYSVLPNQQGVVTRFGKYVETTLPGLNYHWPFPIEQVYLPSVTTVNETEIGAPLPQGFNIAGQTTSNLMLTGDENIVDIRFAVYWSVKNAQDFIFQIDNPVEMVRSVAESVMREVIGRSPIETILTTGRDKVADDVFRLTQQTLDSYQSGIKLERVAFKEADPPEQVIAAFRDVQAARADKERLVNEANAYKNKVVPEARGKAEQLRQEAEAYKTRIVEEAKGEAKRFEQILTEYNKAQAVTKQRLYIETMEKILKGKDKIIMQQGSNGNIVPYLPLPSLNMPTKP